MRKAMAENDENQEKDQNEKGHGKGKTETPSSCPTPLAPWPIEVPWDQPLHLSDPVPSDRSGENDEKDIAVKSRPSHQVFHR